MPNTNRSTSATHLTNLTLDISQLQAQLKTVDKNMSETAQNAANKAEQIKKSFNKINANLNITDSGNIKNVQSVIKQTVSGIESLESSFLRFQRQLSQNPMNNNAFKQIVKETDNAVRSITALGNKLRDGESLTKGNISSYQRLIDVYKNLGDRLNKLTTEYNRFSSTSKVTANSILSLQTQFKNFAQSLAGSGASGQKGFGELEKQIDKAIVKLDTLYKRATLDPSKGGRGVTKQTAKAVTELETELIRLRGVWNDIQSSFKTQKAENTVLKQTTKDVEKLISSFERLRNSSKMNELTTSSTSNITTSINNATQELQRYYDILQNGGRLTEQQTQKVTELKTTLGILRTELANVYQAAVQSGQGFKTGADAIKNLQTKASEFNNIASQAQKFFRVFLENKTVLDQNSQEFINLRNQVKGVVDQINALNTKFISGGGIVNRQDYAQLLQYNQALAQLKLALDQAQNAALTTGQGLKQIASSVNVQEIEKLALAYARFTNSMTSKNVQSPELNALVQQARGYEQVLNNLIRNANILGTTTPQMAQQFQQVANALVPLQRQFEQLRPDIAQMNKQYQDMGRSIQSTIKQLQQLEKSVVSASGRNQVARLRQEFVGLSDNLRNLSIDEAQTRLNTLNNRFQDLSRTVPTATSLINSFINSVTQRARWMIAYGFLNSIFSSFSNIIKVIKETEDSVIELQRVLSDAPMQSAMAKELNEIAYEYGQTFENVQEVAIRFAQTGMSWQDTIKATRSTMLGLNTAELEVNTATQGLIAVMAQFNIQAKDLEEVIDKINITADNFPVTSEKIVAALQRAGGTASAFGLSLEQTIGIITALSEATGRSGEAIGTAMNSLISFTMKGSSLKTFAQYFSQIESKAHLTADALAEMNVFDVWKNLSEAMKAGNDEIAQMLASSEDFNELMNEELASAIGLTDEYNAAVAETNQQLVNQEDIYSTVGVYRKNYFIALLNNIDTATAAIANMSNAIGYSEQENVTAMEALSKQFNQLIVAARELAVQFGESGFLDILKLLTQIATAVLQVTKNVGGLRTVFLAFTALLVSVKQISFEKVISLMLTPLNLLQPAITRVNRALEVYRVNAALGATATTSLGAAFKFLFGSFGSVLTLATIVIGAFSAITNAINEHKEAVIQDREETLALGDDVIETTDKIYAAYKKLDEVRSYNVSESATAALQAYNDELERAAEKNVNLAKTVYGNIDTNARQAIEWTEDNLERYKDIIASWGQDLDDLRGSVSTIFGSSAEFDGVEIAFSPILQTENGAVLLSSDTLYNYIGALINKAGDKWEANDLIRLDTEGIEADGIVIKNMIADIGATAKETAEAMHFTGELGSVNQARQEYLKYGEMTVKQAEELKNAQLEMLEVLGYTDTDLNILAQRYGSLDEALEDLLNTQNEYNRASLQESVDKSKEAFADMTEVVINGKDATEEETKALEAMRKVGLETYQSLSNVGNIFTGSTFDTTIKAAQSYEEATTQVAKLNDVIAELENTYTKEELSNNRAYQAMIKWRRELQSGIDTTDKYQNELSLTGATWEETAENIHKAEMAVTTWTNGTEQAILTTKEMEQTLEEINAAYETISDTVDDFQSAYSTLYDVIEEYNETGLLTADMLQSLLELEPQYLELLDTKNGTLAINDERLGDLINANDTYMQQLMALKVAEDAETWALKIREVATADMTEQEIKSALASITLADDIAKAAYECLTGASDAQQFTDAIKDLGTQAGLTGSALDTFTSKVGGTINTMLNLMNMFKSNQSTANDTSRINRYYTPKTSTSSSSGSSSKSKQDTLKEELNDRLEVYEHSIFLLEKANGDAQDLVAIYRKMQEEVHALAEKYRSMGLSEESSYIMDLSEKWWSLQDEILDVLASIYDETVSAHENALSLLENQYNQLERGANYAGMTENLRKQYDIQRQLQEEAHKEAQRLRQLGVDENDDAIQACIKAWWTAEDAIQEINSKIEDSILDTYDDFIDMADKFDLWEYMDLNKVDYLYEKLNAINDMFKEGTISLKEYNEQLKEMGEAIYEAQVDELEKQKDDMDAYYDKLIARQQKDIDSLEKDKNHIEEYYDSVIEGYESEIEIWEKRKEEVEDYYDKLIERLQEVEDANERINEQLDYYSERQKIITNIEQAQSRSGIEWREKEMEYQQQLIDLDEDWRRTQEEWNIEDQIANLERLRDLAISDIDATIEKINQFITDAETKSAQAIEEIDTEIAGIERTIEHLEQKAEDEIAIIDGKISELSQRMAEAIKNGTADGLVDTSKEFEQATRDIITTLGGTVVEGQEIVNTGVEDTAKQSIITINDMMFEPMKQNIIEISNLFKDSFTSAAQSAAQTSLSNFKQNLTEPLQQELQNTMQEAQNAQTASTQTQTLKQLGSNTLSKTKNKINSDGSVTNVLINQNVATATKGYEKAQSILQKLRIHS